jgi:hypothetical protein
MVKFISGFSIICVVFQCEYFELFVMEVRELHFLCLLLRRFGNGVYLHIDAM